MCVCPSIKPGMPVYLERSITSAPLGIAALPVATLRTRSSSTMTTAFVNTRPVASINLPNLIALVAATAVEDVARKNRTKSTLALRMRPPEPLDLVNELGRATPRSGDETLAQGASPGWKFDSKRKALKGRQISVGPSGLLITRSPSQG